MEQVFNKLTELIKNNAEIFLMTHQNPDFDGMSSAIALQQIINKFKKESYIVRNNKINDVSLNKAYKYMSEKNIDCTFISKTEALEKVKDNSLLIILDTQRTQLVELPELLNKTNNVIVLDHHIKSKDSIIADITYINSNLSSIVELITHYMRYLNFNVDPLIATFMLIGLEIDTSNFRLKTTDKTYETAAILARQGADNVIKQELLQEKKDDYVKRQKLIEKSYMINDNIALCVADTDIYTNQDLASIALKLLKFENVEASFAIGKIKENTIGISARSIGRIDVEEIMTKLGGGGHLNEAATQIADSTLDKAREQLLDILGGK